VLVTVTLLNSVHSSLPQISDAMWISDYLLTSLLLSCLAAIHFSLVQFFLLLEKARETKLKNLLSIEKVAKELIQKVRGDGLSLLQLLDRIHPDSASDVMQCEASLIDQRSTYKASIILSGPNTFERQASPDCIPQQAETTGPHKQWYRASALDREALPDSTPQEAETTGPDQERPPFPVVPDSTSQEAETEGPDELTSLPVNLDRASSKNINESLNIKEVDLSVIMWARDLFIKIDKRHTNQLRPRDVRCLLWKFNLYWTEESTAKVMCMFLRDHNVKTPDDEMIATISLGLFIEFLIEVSHYSLAVRPARYAWARSLSPSELCDVLMRCVFPWLLILKITFFIALIDKYP